MAEEGRRQAAEASLKALQERLAQQTEQIIALQACVPVLTAIGQLRLQVGCSRSCICTLIR